MNPAGAFHGVACCHARFEVPFSWDHLSKVWHPEIFRIGAKLIFVLTKFKCKVHIAQAAWLRCLNSAAFASLKKYASHFFNSAFGGTEPKEALYETTGFRCEVLKSKSRTTG